MSAKTKILDIKAKTKDKFEKKNTNHRLLNLMFAGFFVLIILFTLVGGTNVDVGSVVVGDGDSVVVRQNYFQVARAAAGAIFMSDDGALEYVRAVDLRLRQEFGVSGLSYALRLNDGGERNSANEFTGERGSGVSPPVSGIADLARIVEEIEASGGNASRINWILYRYAFARTVMHTYTEDILVTDPEFDHFRVSWAGNMAVAIIGQAVLRAIASTLLLIVALVMLVFNIIAIIKKKAFAKPVLSFVVLTIAALIQIVFNFNFLRLDWAWVLVIVLTFVWLAGYVLIKHIQMDNRDFSMSVFIHNAAFVVGGVLSLILLTGPLFRVMSLDYGLHPYGISSLYGINLLYDLTVVQTAYSSTVPMAYFLAMLVTMLILGLPFVMNGIFLVVNLKKFINADYTHNERRVMLSIFVAVNVIVFLILGIVNIGLSDIYLSVTPLWAIFVIQPLIVIGMLVFEIMFKVKPVRKELVVN